MIGAGPPLYSRRMGPIPTQPNKIVPPLAVRDGHNLHQIAERFADVIEILFAWLRGSTVETTSNNFKSLLTNCGDWLNNKRTFLWVSKRARHELIINFLDVACAIWLVTT